MNEKELKTQNLLGELYEYFITEDLNTIKLINSENKEFQKIRENHPQDQELVMLCREALFNNAKDITFFRGRIEHERERIKKLS